MSDLRELPLTNRAYGFPHRGDARKHRPRVLAVVHVTGNANNQGREAATNERNYANRIGSTGPSAHYYIDRDGGGVHAIDESRFAAWSNGDLDRPNLSNSGVQYLASIRNLGLNANEGCYLEIEGVGVATSAGQYTDAQFETIARLIADASHETGLAINRQTVLTHGDINSVDRPNCAFLASRREASMSKLISRAREIAEKGDDTGMRNYTITPEATSGTITVETPGHWYLDLFSDKLAPVPIPPVFSRPAFGPVHLTETIDHQGDPADASRRVGYVFRRLSGQPGFVLATDTRFVADSDDNAAAKLAQIREIVEA